MKLFGRKMNKMTSQTAASAVTVLTLVVLFAGVVLPTQAQTVSTLYSFSSNNNSSPTRRKDRWPRAGTGISTEFPCQGTAAARALSTKSVQRAFSARCM